MRRFRLPVIGLTALAVVAGLVGCTNGQALTVGDAPKATAAAPAPVDASKQVLTAGEAKSSLPRAADLGPKWIAGTTGGTGTASSKNDGTYSPAKCAFSSSTGSLKGLSLTGAKPVASAKASFKTKSSGGLSFDGTVVQVQSYKNDVDTSVFPKIRDVLAACKKFTYTDSNGVTSDFRVLPLSLPKYGDQTLAFRLQVSVSMFVLVLDVVEVANGHNVVSIYQAGLGGLDTKATGKAVSATMSALDKATTKT